MLLQLNITNLATIEKLTVEFQPGFSILTGETGAGKSIIIDALQLITGQKGGGALIRSGADRASVEATFEVKRNQQVQQLLEDMDIPLEDGELIIRRVLQSNGRQKIFLNDVTTSLTRLDEIGTLLVNIHGQHDNQALLHRASHIHFLDGFGGLLEARAQIAERNKAWQQSRVKLHQVRQSLAQRALRMEELQFQVNDIEKAGLKPGEEEDLKHEASVLGHAERLRLLFAQINLNLYENDQSVCSLLGNVQQNLEEAANLDERCERFVEPIQNNLYQLEDHYREFSAYADNLTEDPQRLDWVNQRLSLIGSLKRKYGDSVGAILEHLKRSRSELEAMEHLDEDLKQLEQQTEALRDQLIAQSIGLSEQRKQSADKLEQQIMSELHQLGMEKARFAIQVQRPERAEIEDKHLTTMGVDQVEFLLSVNPGQELRSLSKVASGGELSRIMLALKTVLCHEDPTETLVFDEIDTGISGHIAEIVGLKLRSLGTERQALCITHLPQIVACSEHHYKVSKTMQDQATFTQIEALKEKDKVEELARMMGGSVITANTRKLAKEMRGRVAKGKREN